MRDGYPLAYRRFEGPKGAPLVMLIHGSGWHGMQFTGLARQLSARATVLAPDLRGHGTAPGNRGDIDYLDQFEDDLHDLITATKTPGQKVVLGGHSSGGGLVVRFAGGQYGDTLDGAILLAPYLKHDAPTTRARSGSWAVVQTRRLIGLSILNALHIRALNHLPVVQFRMPQVVLDGPLGDTATTRYSYRLNTGFAPRNDFLADAARLPRFLLVVGAQDEAFVAEAYAPTLTAVTDKGRYVTVGDVNHLGIVDAPQTAEAIEEFLDEL